MLLFVFMGLPMVALIANEVVEAFAHRSLGNLLLAALGAAVTIGLFGMLGYWWRRERRYGESVCRLLTLPGVVGGWLKADVACRLPPGPEPVVVHLRNVIGEGKGQREIWRMEEKLWLPDSPLPDARRIVSVRLRIPHDQRQQATPVQASFFQEDFHWVLDIEKETAGVDFSATFRVPVYDGSYGDPAEQGPD